MEIGGPTRHENSPRMLARDAFFLLGLLLIVCWGALYLVEYAYLCRSQLPTRTIDLCALYLLPMSLAVVCALIVATFLRRQRCVWYVLALVAILVLMWSYFAAYPTRRYPAWAATFHRLTVHSQPLIQAITAYQHDHHGTPPPTLAALVPEYLPAVPTTGITASPRYIYWVYNGVWSLQVDCPRVIFDFSHFAYMTPEYLKEWGRSRKAGEQIGNWVYIRD